MLCRAFFEALSASSRAMRFFSAGVNLRDAARWAADVEGQDRFGLVALHGAAKAIVGHAVYVRTEAAQAEVAFEVLDAWQGKGLATILLGQLAEAAEQSGIDVFSAEVMPSNHRMLEIFRESGFSPTYRSGSGSVRIEFPVTLSAEGQERYERREQIAASAALRSFLRPASIAVIGASRRRGTIGGEIFHNLLSAGFPGPVYPVNPTAGVVQSVMAYPRSRTSRAPWSSPSWPYRLPRSPASSASAPRRVSGVRSLVVISAGFSESGDEGAARQHELVEICRDAGMRLIGPNCMGLVSTDPAMPLNATFAPAFPPRGAR